MSSSNNNNSKGSLAAAATTSKGFLNNAPAGVFTGGTVNCDDVKELAWKCHNCSRHNHLHKLKCPNCSARKGRSHASTRMSTDGCEIVWGIEKHGDMCGVCGDGGELICCDNCDKVYHGNCLQVDDVSTLLEPWHCPACDPNSCGNLKTPGMNPGKTKQDEHWEQNETVDDVTPNMKKEDDYDPDHCYMCYNGGLLVCCDHCDKSFHKHCHVPPLHSVPEGYWKCCECSASSYSKRWKCGECKECLREDCGKCIYCLDKPKFGGINYLKQVCDHKRCPNKRYAPPATVTSGVKKKRKSKMKQEEDIDDNHIASLAKKMGVVHNTGKRKYTKSSLAGGMSNANETVGARRSKRAHKPSLKAKETATLATPEQKARDIPKSKTTNTTESCARGSNLASTIEVSPAPTEKTAGAIHNTASPESFVARGSSRPATSIEVPVSIGGNDCDAYSQATMPFPKDDYDGNDTPSDLLMCQMELKRARAENKRQANEIKRLKSAVQALTASLTE